MDLFRADDKKRGGDGGGGRPTFFPKKGDPKGKKFLKDETKDEKKKTRPCALRLALLLFLGDDHPLFVSWSGCKKNPLLSLLSPPRVRRETPQPSSQHL
tara:strand:- start:3364 stop:3660 length:297 start_codon:yes stop_codon:yes gene_type:complete